MTLIIPIIILLVIYEFLVFVFADEFVRMSKYILSPQYRADKIVSVETLKRQDGEVSVHETARNVDREAILSRATNGVLYSYGVALVALLYLIVVVYLLFTPFYVLSILLISWMLTEFLVYKIWSKRLRGSTFVVKLDSLFSSVLLIYLLLSI